MTTTCPTAADLDRILAGFREETARLRDSEAEAIARLALVRLGAMMVDPRYSIAVRIVPTKVSMAFRAWRAISAAPGWLTSAFSRSRRCPAAPSPHSTSSGGRRHEPKYLNSCDAAPR